MKVHCPGGSKRERGSVVLIFIMLLAVMLILVAADTKALYHLDQEIKLLNRQQLERLNVSQTTANLIVPPPMEMKSK